MTNAFPSRRFWSVIAVIVAIFVDTAVSIHFHQADTDQVAAQVRAAAAEQAMFNHAALVTRGRFASSHAGLHTEDAEIIRGQSLILERLEAIGAKLDRHLPDR